MTNAAVTPGTERTRGRITQSVRVRSSAAEVSPDSLQRPTIRIWPMTEEIGASIGVIPSGSVPESDPSFSATIWRSTYRLVDQSNSAWTIETPMALELRTARTPGDPLRAASMGKVTCASTSSGARPCASVMTVTRGRLRSGKTSIGSVTSDQPPMPRTASAMASVIQRCVRAA